MEHTVFRGVYPGEPYEVTQDNWVCKDLEFVIRKFDLFLTINNKTGP